MPLTRRSATEPGSDVAAVLAALEEAADPTVCSEMASRYGIRTPKAMGVSMAKMKAIATPLGTNHTLATEQWACDDREYVRRAAFALLWSLALHRSDALDDEFRQRLPLIESHSSDPRHRRTGGRWPARYRS